MQTFILILIAVFCALGLLAFLHNLIFIQCPRWREPLFKTFRPMAYKQREEKRQRERDNGNSPIYLPRTDGRGEVIVWAKSKTIAVKKYNTYLYENRNKQPREIFTKRKHHNTAQ